MPCLLHCKQLQALRNVHDNLVIARYVELVKYMIDKLLEEPDSEDESDSDSSLDDNRSITMSISSISLDSSWNSLMSGITATTSHSLGVSSQFLSDRPEMATPAFAEFIDAVRALHDEAQKSRVLDTRPKLIRALQLHLLPEWEMYAP